MTNPSGTSGTSGTSDLPEASDASLRAAVLLARSRAGDETLSEELLRREVGEAGSAEDVVRGAAALVGGLAGLIREIAGFGDTFDPPAFVAASLRRMQRSQVLGPDGFPWAAALLTTALVVDVDTLAWLDEVGPRPLHLAPTIEVLSELIDFADTMYDRPGTAVELLSDILADPSAAV